MTDIDKPTEAAKRARRAVFDKCFDVGRDNEIPLSEYDRAIDEATGLKELESSLVAMLDIAQNKGDMRDIAQMALARLRGEDDTE